MSVHLELKGLKPHPIDHELSNIISELTRLETTGTLSTEQVKLYYEKISSGIKNSLLSILADAKLAIMNPNWHSSEALAEFETSAFIVTTLELTLGFLIFSMEIAQETFLLNEGKRLWESIQTLASRMIIGHFAEINISRTYLKLSLIEPDIDSVLLVNSIVSTYLQLPLHELGLKEERVNLVLETALNTSEATHKLPQLLVTEMVASFFNAPSKNTLIPLLNALLNGNISDKNAFELSVKEYADKL